MAMPGFTAEAALGRPRVHYAAQCRARLPRDTAAIHPQLVRSVCSGWFANAVCPTLFQGADLGCRWLRGFTGPANDAYWGCVAAQMVPFSWCWATCTVFVVS